MEKGKGQEKSRKNRRQSRISISTSLNWLTGSAPCVFIFPKAQICVKQASSSYTG